MSALATGVVLARWEILSAVIMFFASTLNISLRRASRHGLALLSSSVGIAVSCWFVMGLLGITSADMALYGAHAKDLFVEIMSQAPQNWPMP
ncbi:YjcB family protein [Nissabacter sp. SGAir0207]|uniref:YjcB family protein n=1 Tax=Nissabacter sp. SGAir0207 TaxID=2126321 RepID=UPI0010CD3E21|nr:YjcB family protein [Nissabacter sp. SGAir0207]QCR38488.1 hypothetical protein C1N62_20370 [Nissabacter sp. SGAir0207]